MRASAAASAARIAAVTNASGDTAVLTVIPGSAPDTTATEDLVHTIRDLDGTLGVTGTTALNLDISEKLADALIMMSVFFGFMLGPDAITKSIGFGLGVAILFDAIVVRMILVPAVMALLGRAAWWLPRGLDRVLPDVDVEGEKLQRHLTPPPAAADRELILR